MSERVTLTHDRLNIGVRIAPVISQSCSILHTVLQFAHHVGRAIVQQCFQVFLTQRESVVARHDHFNRRLRRRVQTGAFYALFACVPVYKSRHQSPLSCAALTLVALGVGNRISKISRAP